MRGLGRGSRLWDLNSSFSSFLPFLFLDLCLLLFILFSVSSLLFRTTTRGTERLEHVNRSRSRSNPNGPIRVENETTLRAAVVACLITRVSGKPKR